MGGLRLCPMWFDIYQWFHTSGGCKMMRNTGWEYRVQYNRNLMVCVVCSTTFRRVCVSRDILGTARHRSTAPTTL